MSSEVELQEERNITDGKGRATPGRRNRTKQSNVVVESGNFFTRPFISFWEYIQNVRAELEKVTWPTRPEVFRLTRIVLAVTVASALALFAITFVLSELIKVGVQTPALLVGLVVLMIVGSGLAIWRSNRTTSSY